MREKNRVGVPLPGLALIFDMDGVIVDSMAVHVRVWREYLASFGMNVGLGNDEIVLNFLDHSADGKGVREPQRNVHEHGAAKERLYRETMRGQLARYLVPGVVDFLKRSNAAPVALASNAERANIDFILDEAKLRPYFRVVVDAAQVQRPKPAPDLFLFAAERLGVAPRNCVVFEDSPAGTLAARAAGMRVVGILTHAAILKDVDCSAPHFLDPELGAWLSKQRAV